MSGLEVSMTLTHIDDQGRATMVDVSAKPVTTRTAVASALVRMSPATIDAVRNHRTTKGDPLETARIAGIMASKHTAELIPLCHTLPIHHADVQVRLVEAGVSISATVTTEARTGVEMEAMVAASVAALTVYDMCKALERGIVLTDIRLESKTGGKSGDYARAPNHG